MNKGSTQNAERIEMLSVTWLKSRGWTETLIRRFGGEPDQLKTNPYYRSAAPMRLYRADRIEEIEKSDSWLEAKSKSQARVDGAIRAAETKRQELFAWVDGLTFSITHLSQEELIKRACTSYNTHQEDIETRRNYYGKEHNWSPAAPDSDPAFLQRITVNYLRHSMSKYDAALEMTFGKVGVREAYAFLNQRIYDAIAATYSDLKDECVRQYTKKMDARPI